MRAPTLLDFADYLYNKQELYHNIMKKLSDSITICIIINKKNVEKNDRDRPREKLKRVTCSL